MSYTLVNHNGHPLDIGDLKRLQKLAVQVTIAVKADDGEELCRMVAGADLAQPDAPKDILIKFVNQWANNYDALMERVVAKKFGHLHTHDITFMEVLSVTGALVLSTLKLLARDSSVDPDVEGHVAKLSHTLCALQILHSSYESNPSDEDLNRLVPAA